MKTMLKIGEMVDHCPAWLKDAVSRVAKDSGIKTDDMELHRHSHSEKSAVNGIDPKSRQSLKYVSARTQDRDAEIVIPQALDLKSYIKCGCPVLVNHNYSLLPVGSDEWIQADDWGVKALTNHADTGDGTLANVVWALVRDGHLKTSSVGFVPTAFTKPGARDWDRVANQLQSNWKEFDKDRAEKSLSRIITGGVLLEHSFVSVPCNPDAGMIQVMKGLVSDNKVMKQLGWDKVEEKADDPSGFLVKDKDGNGHLPTRVNGKLDHGHMGAAWAALHGGYRGNKYEGPDKAEAIAKLKKLYESEGMDLPSEKFYIKVIKTTTKVGDVSETVEKEVTADEEVGETLTDALLEVLQSTFAFYTLAHGSHWNVIGPDFTEWHQLFGDIYEDAWEAVDPLAENIRKLGGQAPANLSALTDPTATTPEPATDPRALAVDLLVANAKLIDEIKDAFNKATEDEEQGIANFLAERQDHHAKFGWQLKASLGLKGFSDHAVMKPNPHIPGHSFTACVAIMEGKGHDNESAKRICGALQANSGEKGLTEAEVKSYREVKKTAGDGISTGDDESGGYAVESCECDECGAKRECKPGAKCAEKGCEGKMQPVKAEKSIPAEIKVVRPAQIINVLFTPPDPVVVAKGISDAVERALSRRTGKLL